MLAFNQGLFKKQVNIKAKNEKNFSCLVPSLSSCNYYFVSSPLQYIVFFMQPKRLQSDQPTQSVDSLQQQASALSETGSISQNKSSLIIKLTILLITFLGALILPRAIYYIFIYQPLEAPEGGSGVLGMLFKEVEESRRNPIINLPRLRDSINNNAIQKNKISEIQIKRKELLKQLKDEFTLHKNNKQKQNQIFELKYQFNLLSKFLEVSRKKDNHQKAYEYYRNYQYPLIKINPQPRPLYIPSRQEAQNYDQKKDLILYTPAGRRMYLQILFRYLSKQRESFNRWHLWVNTNKNSDIQYMDRLANENDWIKTITLDQYVSQPGHINNIRRFWRKDCEKNKVYLRVDDDTVWMSPDFVDKMYQARIKDVQPIFIFANIINNGIIEYVHQRAGNFIYKDAIQYDCMGNAWSQLDIAKQIHEQFLESAEKNETDKWKTSFNKWYALNYERISINSLIYFSNTINSMEFFFNADQEQLFSSDIAHYYERKNLVLNDPICVHYAFGIQRKFLDQQNPQILVRYQKLAEI